MSIVGLDISTYCGIATLYDGGAAPVLSTVKLRSDTFDGANDDIGRAMECLRSTLADIHTIEPITYLFFEAAILPRAKVDEETGRAHMQTSPQTVYKLCAFAGMAEWFAKRVNAICRQVEQAKWRKHFFGKGTGKSKELKALAIEAAKARGWNVDDDHQADAAGVLEYGMACFNLDRPWRDWPLLPARRPAPAPPDPLDCLPHDKAMWRDYEADRPGFPAPGTGGKRVSIQKSDGTIFSSWGDQADWSQAMRWRFGWAPKEGATA